MRDVFAEEFLNLCDFLLGGRLVGGDQVVEELIDATHIARHAVFQHIVGVGLVTQQLGQFTADVDQALADLKVVLRIIVDAHGVLGQVHLPAQLTTGTVSHEGGIRGEVEGEHPTVFALFLCGLGSSLTGCVGQSVEIGLVGDMQGEGLVLLQQILRELEAEHRGFLRELAQAFLAGSIEEGTAAHETVVAVVEQHLLLGCQLTVVAVHILDALKEFLIEADVVGMLREDGTHLLGQRVHLVVRLGREQVEEHGAHPRQQVVIACPVLLVVDTDDRIVEGGFLRVVDKLLYLFVVATDALEHRFLIVLQTDTVERGRIVGRTIREEKGILSHFVFFHIFILHFLTSNY